MDLSKLYFESEPDSQTVIDVNRVVKGWIDDSSAAIGENVESKFKNIKLVSTPYYQFKFNFQTIEREFYNGSMGYRNQDIPAYTGNHSVGEYSFDSFSVPEVSFEDNEEENPTEKRFIIDGTQKVYTCSTCNGIGNVTCKSCSGKGEERCSSCNGKGKEKFSSCNGMGIYKCSSCNGSGWKKCSHCNGAGGVHGAGWIECRSCHGKGEIRCERCGGKGEIRCTVCGAKGEVDCKKCKGSGIVRCNHCGGKGHVTCGRCDGAGRIMKFIGRKDTFTIESDFDIVQYNSAVPQSLKAILTGDDAPSATKLLSFTDGNPIIDSIDSPSVAQKTFELSKFSSMGNQLNDLKDRIEFSSVENDENVTKKALKVRTRVYQINITHVTYDYEEKSYELWVYGKNNVIFNETNPFLIIAQKNESEAEELLKEKKYAYAISKLEKSCRIAEASKNYEALCSFSEKLNDTRKKSNVDYLLGLGLGALFTFLFYSVITKITPFVYPSSEKLVSQGLELSSPKAISFFSGSLNTIVNYITPLFFSATVFIRLVRDKIKDKKWRILVPSFVLLLYALVRSFISTKFLSFAESSDFMMISIILIIVAVVIAVAVKEPYKVIPSPYETEEAASSESNDEVSDDEDSESSSSRILAESPKHRLIALILALFLGIIGVHRIYVGKIKSGLLQFVLFVAGCYFSTGTEGQPETAKPVLGGIIIAIVAIWMVLDIIMICAGKYKDKYGAVIKDW